MNRLLTEGRRAFLQLVSGIQRGAECARYEPLLSALADGEASAEDLARLRPHMQTCLSCRAALREFRAMPERVASVVPPAALVAADGGGPVRNLLESAIGAAQHKTAAMGERLHAAAELATGQKLAAMAASAAALAGGGTAIDEFANHERAARAAQSPRSPRRGPCPRRPIPRRRPVRHPRRQKRPPSLRPPPRPSPSRRRRRPRPIKRRSSHRRAPRRPPHRTLCRRHPHNRRPPAASAPPAAALRAPGAASSRPDRAPRRLLGPRPRAHEPDRDGGAGPQGWHRRHIVDETAKGLRP